MFPEGPPVTGGSAEGRTEILRCLKRYIAREIYPRLPSPASLGGLQR